MAVKKFYVTMHDTFMSGWGPATGKKNVLVIECDTSDQAALIYRNAKRRSEMKSVKVATQIKAPKFNAERIHPSLKVFADMSGPWLEGAAL